jgi:hypothetical protein
MAIARSLEVQLAPELLNLFFPLLQQGVEVEVETGGNLKQMLIEQFGIPADYIASRITTLFLNYKAVDDAATALIHDSAVVALSGAMPGLVGATMRSGGFYAAMRGAMTYHNEAEVPVAKRGRIRLKLFNLLLDELGPRILRRGVVVSAAQLRAFLAELPTEFRFHGCWLDGRPLAVEPRRTIPELPGDEELLKLKVQFGES